ncbi:DUF6153 family protein [Microbacterium sp. Marseille-Q6648]|uniref:DUF6153 family protein n=1 Tax=Microbacterium sp. Marseille-Q6648 TaxID=2937991 RepID=UPI00203CECAD|nr:DUF6153 family protein [Microbacterium sp. Marseille-Q6648]
MSPTLTRRHAQPPVFWRWAASALLAALVVLGLLGMHTLSTAHGDTGLTTVAAAEHSHAHAVTESGATDAEVGCADCGAGHDHSAMMLACALALMVAMILIGRVGRAMRHHRHPILVIGGDRPPVEPSPRPPSLVELSISRT